jgi:hypothetical protein
MCHSKQNNLYFFNFNSKNKAQNIDNFNQNLQKIAQHKVKCNASKTANI